MDDPAIYDADAVAPLRAEAVPTLDVVAAGFTDICCLQPVWLRITEALVRWLQHHFAAATRIEHQDLTRYVWAAAPATAGIHISSLAEWKPVLSNNRPALLIDRLEQRKYMEQRGIGDQLQGVAPGSFANLMEGQHVIHCLGGREGEAENLAWEVWRELERFASVARTRLGLMKFFPVQTGRRVQLPEHKETYTIPVTCVYGYLNEWRVTSLDEAEVTAIFLAPPG